MALVVVAAPSASAKAKPETLTKVIDSIEVPTPAHTASHINEYIPSKVVLDQGEDYRLVAVGRVEQFFNDPEQTADHWTQEDALYCYRGPGCATGPTADPQDPEGGSAPLLVNLEGEVLSDFGRGTKPIHKFAGDPLPAYNDKFHRYEVVFRAAKSERLLAFCNCADAQTVQLFPDYQLATGVGFDIYLYTAPDERRLCPEMRTDDGEHGRANHRCEYGVPWKLKQSGLQANPAIGSDSDLIGTTTTGEGVVYFSDEPDFDKDERVKGAILRIDIRQVDEYLRAVPTGPDAFEQEVSLFTGKKSILTGIRGGRNGTELTVPPYLLSNETPGCRQSLGFLTLTDNGSNDAMKLVGVSPENTCHLNREFRSGEAENEQLKVRIGKPVELKDT
jgi:hypothetical protein